MRAAPARDREVLEAHDQGPPAVGVDPAGVPGEPDAGVHVHRSDPDLDREGAAAGLRVIPAEGMRGHQSGLEVDRALGDPLRADGDRVSRSQAGRAAAGTGGIDSLNEIIRRRLHGDKAGGAGQLSGPVLVPIRVIDCCRSTARLAGRGPEAMKTLRLGSRWSLSLSS